MTGRICIWSVALFGALAGVSSATPPQIIRTDERFFGAGEKTYAVIRSVTDNQGSYYQTRVVTSLVERSREDGAVVAETLLLDREERIDAGYEGPGDPPVTVVIHAKNQQDLLGTLIERWPHQGQAVEAEELKRFTIEGDALSYDKRLRLLGGGPVVDELVEEAPLAEWKIEEGLQTGNTLCLRLRYEDEAEGDTRQAWISVGPELAAQVKAFRKLEDIYLSPGSFTTVEEAVKRAAGWREPLEKANFATTGLDVWEASDPSGQPRYLVVVKDSGDLIKSGRIAELEKLLGVRTVPVENARFQKWIAVPAN